MKPFFLIFFALSFLILNSCDEKEKSEQLQIRESKLLEKEKEFALKEAEYQSLVKMRDSIFSEKDSVKLVTLPEFIHGKWSGKMICTESNCPENMIGDVRTDNWEFSATGNVVSAKVTNKAGNIRVYSGSYTGSEMRLSFMTDSTAAKKMDISIVLNDLSQNKIRGFREISGENNCISRFSVDLDKSKN